MKLIALLIFGWAAFAQGTPITVKTWTKIANAKGFPASTLGYESSDYSATYNATCFPGGYHEQNNEIQQALECWRFDENRWFVPFEDGGAYADAFRFTGGHSPMFSALDDGTFWFPDGQTGSNQVAGRPNHTYLLDAAGRFLRDVQTGVGATNYMPYDGGNVFGTSSFDSFNSKVVIWAEWLRNVFIWDKSTREYTRPTTTGTPHPIDTYFAASAYNSTNHKFYIYGGGTCAGTKSQVLSVFDAATNVWATVTQTGDPTYGLPPARANMALAYSPVDDILLLASGCDASTAASGLTDSWAFHFATATTGTWERIDATGLTGVYQTYRLMAYDSVNNAFVLFSKGNATTDYSGGAFNRFPVGVWVLCYSACLNVGRTSNTYSPPAGYVNTDITGATTRADSQVEETSASGTSVVVDGSSNVLIGWVDQGTSFGDSDANGRRHPKVLSRASGVGTVLTNTLDSAGTSSEQVRLAMVSGTLWMFWSNQSYSPPVNPAIKAAYYSGGSWNAVSSLPIVNGSTNYSGITSAIGIGAVPTVARIENTNASGGANHLYVNQYSGGSWSVLGSASLLVNSGGRAVSVGIATDGSNPCVAWTEDKSDPALSGRGLSLTPQLYLKCWNGSAWGQVGASLNNSASAFAYSAAISYSSTTGLYYVTATERTTAGTPVLRVLACSTSACSVIGSDLRYGSGWPAGPQLVSDGSGNTYLTWVEQSAIGSPAKAFVKKWDGTSWALVGGAINADQTNGSAADVSISLLGGQPVVAWTESTEGNMRQVYTATVGATVGTPAPLRGGFRR